LLVLHLRMWMRWLRAMVALLLCLLPLPSPAPPPLLPRSVAVTLSPSSSHPRVRSLSPNGGSRLVQQAAAAGQRTAQWLEGLAGLHDEHYRRDPDYDNPWAQYPQPTSSDGSAAGDPSGKRHRGSTSSDSVRPLPVRQRCGAAASSSYGSNGPSPPGSDGGNSAGGSAMMPDAA
jgi:hypothetical protein